MDHPGASGAAAPAADRGARRPAHTRGSRSGIFSTAGSAGQLLGIFVSGVTVQLFGFSTLYALCSLMSLSAAICFWVLRLRTPRPVQLADSATV